MEKGVLITRYVHGVPKRRPPGYGKSIVVLFPFIFFLRSPAVIHLESRNNTSQKTYVIKLARLLGLRCGDFIHSQAKNENNTSHQSQDCQPPNSRNGHTFSEDVGHT